MIQDKIQLPTTKNSPIDIPIKHIVPPVLSFYMEGVANYVYQQKDHHDQMVAPQQVNP